MDLYLAIIKQIADELTVLQLSFDKELLTSFEKWFKEVTKEKIGDVQGKAATLHCIAIIYANQGEVDQAISLYQQSLEIQEKIGNIKGKAITSAMMAQLKVILGDIEEAIQDFQTAIEILTKLKSPIAQQVQDIFNQILQPSS